ncbi:hypothetical protein WJX72_001819 [[Myrmecia] bisecta]|uniref:DUF1995 domain-containing protein n=1 Tax=[Myrmecia] bisecta TaxID=41462 RepID=A0AAW1QEC4_9CHLO
MVKMAAAAVQRGLDEGQLRHKVDFLLPVNEKEANFMAIDAVDYPCSLQKEFEACCSLTRLLLEELLGSGTKLLTRRVESGGGQGEPCCVIYPESKAVAAIVFPTADRLSQIKALAKEEGRALLIVNPQWRESGQVVSDFGIGPWKRAAMDFLATFRDSFLLAEQRIGAPGSIDMARGDRYNSGGVVRLLGGHPGGHEVYILASNGSSQRAGMFQHAPSYRELEQLLRDARAAKLDIFEVARRASVQFADDSSDRTDPASSTGEGADGGGPGSLSEAQIDAMDAVSLRRSLAAYSLPTSGRVAKLRERLKEAVAKP